MASLNTLRTRGGIVVSIVIGIALIAFLLGDFMPRSCSEHNVGEINGKKISYIEYSNQSDLYSVVSQVLSGRETLSTEDQEMARNMAWESLTMKYSYQPGFEKMGLWVSEAEQVDMVSGAYLSPVITGMFANPETGIYDPAILRNFITNANNDPTGRAQVLWEYFKEQMNTHRVMNKYVTLISKAMYTNDLEVSEGVHAANNTYDAKVTGKNYSEIPDSLINISSNDIRAYYNNNKNKFKQEASREIEYVVFNLLPSDQDYEDARKYIEEIAEEFAVTETPMQYATLNSQISPNTRYLSDEQIDPAIMAAVWNKPEAMYGPVLSGDTYTLAREADSRMLSDTLGAKHILLESGQTELADSLVKVLKAGSDFATLAREYSMDQNANLQGGDLGIFSPEQMIPEFSEAVMNAKRGDIITVNTSFGIHVVEVTYRSPLVRKAQIATIRYKIDPSTSTQQVVYAEASQFLSEASGSYDNFKKATTEAALSKRVARIRNTDRTVSGVEDSRELVRWAFNGRKGEVSGIMEMGGNYVVASITGVREEGIAALEDVIEAIRPQLYKQKKAELIIPQLSGSSISEVASNTGKEIIDVNDLALETFFIDGVGVEPRLIGAICSTEQTNKLSKPVIAESGVFLFEVENINTSDNATAESERVRLDASASAYLAERLGQALVETSKIKDSRVKYF